ncbi:MAG: hypothetical protein LBR79_05900 [Oscillospiraceae bacterium]|nr:hypothetical protein [Oscillospiraceae bacterium]
MCLKTVEIPSFTPAYGGREILSINLTHHQTFQSSSVYVFSLSQVKVVT